jgi:glycine cleavage system aminomethyltransferase T
VQAVESTSALDILTRRAGAVVNTPHGATVAAHYGSATAELAVCVQAVGLADRSDLVKVAITGDRQAVSNTVAVAADCHLAAHGCIETGGAWWCAASNERIVVVAEPASGPALLTAIRKAAAPSVQITDQSAEVAAIGLVGRRALQVLAALGVLVNPRVTPPFGEATIANERVELLLQSYRRAVVLVDRGAAAEVWQAIEEAGRAFRVSCVGSDALGRFAVLDRMLERAPAAATD